MKALRDWRGRWNLAVYINRQAFEVGNRTGDPTWDRYLNAERIEAVARQHGIGVCASAVELGQTRCAALFLVGHHLEMETPGLLHDLSSLGRRLQGRYLGLYSCGEDEFRVDVQALLRQTQARAIHAAHAKISLFIVRLVFEKLVALVESGGKWPPELAFERAEALVLADLRQA